MSFLSPLTGLPYITLFDLYPPLPEEGTRIKMTKEALNEIRECEKENIGPWDVVFVSLVNRQIDILVKAKAMLIDEKFYVRHHGDPNYATSLTEFEIIPNVKGDAK